MIETMSENETFLSHQAQFEKQVGQRDPAWLRRMRESASERFAELGFPTSRHEDWKFTNVAPLAKLSFQLPPADNPLAVDGYRRLRHDDDSGVSLICMNGSRPFLAAGSNPLPRGVIVSSLEEAIRDHGDLVQAHLGKLTDAETQAFTALNTAFLHHGVFIYVPPGIDVTGPISIVTRVSAFSKNPDVWYRRALLVMDEGSRATVVEKFSGLALAPYFTSMVTEVALGDNACLDHYKVQQEGSEAFHVATMNILQARGSNFSSHYIGLGGALVRNESRVLLDGEGCECTLNGLYLASGRQHMDNHTVIDHAKPHCASHELYKGILDGKAHGVFNGKIFVHQDAQKTDAKQTNKTLLLSEDAVINTKPQLEIYADDVKCTHGATVGQLDAEGLFYLRSRGIGLAEARSLLTYAFANDVTNRIKVEPLRVQLEELLLARQNLPQDELAKECYEY